MRSRNDPQYNTSTVPEAFAAPALDVANGIVSAPAAVSAEATARLVSWRARHLEANERVVKVDILCLLGQLHFQYGGAKNFVFA